MEKAAIIRRPNMSSEQQAVYYVFDGLLRQLNNLFIYRSWLPIERCQICFYSEKLSSLYQEFLSFTFTDVYSISKLRGRGFLDILVSGILKSKNVSVSFDSSSMLNQVVSYDSSMLNLVGYQLAVDLNSVGYQLAIEVAEIFKASRLDSGKAEKYQDLSSLFHFDKNKFQEVFVGFEAEASNLLQQLASITKKKLEVIPIVGMAGLGKTTLAKRLYNDPYVVSYFYVRAWVTCSQLYQKRDILLGVLQSVAEITDEHCRMNDNTLAETLFRALKGKRYLIVIDDVWSVKAWDDLRACFPDDNNGSRIMLTTRLKSVALHAQTSGDPLCLRFLTEDESFDLLTKKTFIIADLYEDLSLIGKRIIKKCRGLPLAVVIIAGLLRNNFKVDWWSHVAESVSSYIVTDENHYMDTLAMSYNHLPQHLKPCFLCFGAFPEDHDISVSKLICVWNAEGMIHLDGTKKSLEDIAEDYLMDLIGRSLVVVGKKGSDGSIKTCRIHDLLHDLCLRITKEEKFAPNICLHNRCSLSRARSLANPSTNCQLRFNAKAAIPSFYSSEEFFFSVIRITLNTSKLIRALDISSIELYVFPSELLQLVNLRYLELRFRSGNPPESISQLIELQTLVMSSRMNIVVPENMWKMINLKHLCIKSGENFVNFSNVEEETSLLENLQTISLVSPTRQCQHLLAKTSNLKKLGLCGTLTTRSGELNIPDLGHLTNLKMLKLLNTIPLCKAGRLSNSVIFPGSLKSLSVSNTYLGWKEAWVFQMIPNLEVLKLKFHAFVGKDWETCPEAFPRLKFLKLDGLDIATWTASRNHFPVLQRLQVYRCPYLMEIPEDIGNICTLEWIELSGCSDAATNSARDIQKEQESYGNDWLKILLGPG